MANTDNTVPADIKAAIERVLRVGLKDTSLRDIVVRAGEDHDGDPVLFIEAHYDLTEAPFDISVTREIVTQVRDELWERGEKRFPHIRHRPAEGQKIKFGRRVFV